MSADYSKTAAGETVGFWRTELERAAKAWEKRETRRQELRQITSDLAFGRLIFFDKQDLEDHPEIDQRDFNILLRYMDKFRAHAGDEVPEVRWPRDMESVDPRTGRPVSLGKYGDVLDRFTEAVMESAGAPEENEDGAMALCTEGISVWWWEMTGLPSVEDAAEARKGAREITDEAAKGEHEPHRLQDHAALGEALPAGALSDPEMVREQVATSAPGDAPYENVLRAAGEHLEAEQKERKHPLDWRHGKFRLRCTRVPYGTHALRDASVVNPRDARWWARRLEIPLDEARRHPAFRPSVRKNLRVTPFEDQEQMVTVESSAALPEEIAQGANGRVVVWHILDKKWQKEYLLPDEGDEFLAERDAPHTDGAGRSYLHPAGRYHGFFPVVECVPHPLTRHDGQKYLGRPLLEPGLKGQKAVIKLLSYYLHSVKQASSAYHFVEKGIFDQYEDDFAANRGGVFPWPPDLSKDGKPPMVSVAFKPPPVELFREVDREIFRTLQELNFPIASFSSQPIAETATQEEIATADGALGIFDAVRKMEMSYAQQAWVATNVALVEMPDSEIDALIGPVDRQRLREMVAIFGLPRRLPAVTFSPKARSQNPVRVKQLLDFHERLMAEVSPVHGMPRFDSVYLVQEAAKTLGLGAIEEFDITDVEKFNQAVRMWIVKNPDEAEQLLALVSQARGSSGPRQPGAPAANGKTIDSQGKPRGRRELAGRRDNPEGRSIGEATRGGVNSRPRDVVRT